MIFSKQEIVELLEVIDYHHTIFIASTVGTDTLTIEDKELLNKFGIDADALSTKHPHVDQAFRFGILAEALGGKNARMLNFTDFKQYIRAKQYLPLTRVEELALESVKNQAYHDIKGLGHKIGGKLNDIHAQEDVVQRARVEKIIEGTARETIENRKSVQHMVSELGHKTEDWQRDFGRISEYIMHSSYEEGRAAKLEEKDGKDVLVYKDVFPGSCRHCIKHYLTNGVGSPARVFKLADLRANGTNIGRKAPQWLPVLGPMHPWCRCTLNHVPVDAVWDEKTKTYKTSVDFKRKVERKSKIKIVVGDKKFEV